MKRVSAIAAVIAGAMIASSVVYAQDEGGLIGRLRNRFTKKKAAPVPVREAARPAPAKPPVQKAAPPATVPVKTEGGADARTEVSKEFTRDELLTMIRDDIDSEDEILVYIPGLKKKKGVQGETIITYAIEGQDTQLENLKEEDLRKLFSAVQNCVARLRNERIQRQLESIQQVQNMQRTQQAVQNMQNIQRMQNIQNIRTPPVTPPRAPATPPRPPAPPPSPPRK